MKFLRLLIKLPATVRPQWFFLSVIPAVAGGALAFADTSRWDNEIFFVSITAILFLQAAANMISDYALFCRVENNGYSGRLEGAAGAIRNGWLRREQVVGASVMLMMLGGLCAVLLSMLAGGSVLIITAIAIIIGYLAHFPRGGLFKLGAGEFSVAAACSFLPLLAVYALQTMNIDLQAFVVAVPLCILATTLIIIEQMRSQRELLATGSLTARLGPGNCARLVAALTVIWPVLVALVIIFGFLPNQTGISVIGVLPAGWAAIICLKKNKNLLAIETALALSFISYVLTGTGIAAGLLAAGRGLGQL